MSNSLLDSGLQGAGPPLRVARDKSSLRGGMERCLSLRLCSGVGLSWEVRGRCL